MKITSVHGSGGKETSQLIRTLFAKAFQNPVLDRMEDSAVVPGSSRIAMTTDSFVVTPLFFPGGDMGRLSVCGTVNDLLMSGAVPKYMTCGFILEEGAETEDLQKIASSMAETARESGILLVAGDTKVIEGSAGIYINTAGVGFLPEGLEISASNCRPGDAVIVSGNLGDHHAAIVSARMGITNTIESDCAPLCEMTAALQKSGVRVRAMRDITRGGLATILNEFAQASRCGVELEEASLPVDPQVAGFCSLLGLDPLYMGNEGKLAAVVDSQDAEKALAAIKASRYGENAACIGHVIQAEEPAVLLKTKLGGTRIITELYGEGLPRIC